MGKEIITQVQETQRVPNRINPRRNTPRHILIKLTKIKHKEQILKAAREKQQITHKGIPIRITADLSIETLQARREWQDILKMMKENNLQPSKTIYSDQEIENIKIAFPMGLCMISEGVIPIAMNDIVRTICATSIGCGVTGAISFSLGVESGVPSGGVFVIPAMTNPLFAVFALLTGSLVTATILIIIKKEKKAGDDQGLTASDEAALDLSDFKFS